MSNIGWQYIPFAKAAKVISDEGKRVKQRDYLPEGKVPVIDQGQDFIGGYINDEAMTFKGDLPVIIFGDHTRNIKFVTRPFAVGAEGVKILKPELSYEPKFFYYMLYTLNIPSRGYSRHFQFLKKNSVPLIPVGEQKLIIAEIEKQFSRLDEAVAALKRIKANLKRYKAAVLKAAVEGKLTEEWRKNNKDVEPAERLLKRILAERKKKWEEKNPKKKYKEPVSPDTLNLPELPKGWVWAKLGEIKEDIENVNPKMNPDKDFIYLDIASINNTQQKITTPKRYLGKDAPSRARQLVKTGDILFSTVRTYLKNIAIVDGKYNNQIASTGFCVIRPLNPINKKLFFYYVQTKPFLNSLTHIQRGTSYPAVRDSDVFEQVSPLPPLLEQQKIIEEIESRLSVTEEIEEAIDINLKRAERLRQAILKKAFSGRLIPQPQLRERASA